MACCGLSPNARSVLPVDHAEIHDPETVQYPESSEYVLPLGCNYTFLPKYPQMPQVRLSAGIGIKSLLHHLVFS
jgi:hypothetical protein